MKGLDTLHKVRLHTTWQLAAATPVFRDTIKMASKLMNAKSTHRSVRIDAETRFERLFAKLKVEENSP